MEIRDLESEGVVRKKRRRRAWRRRLGTAAVQLVVAPSMSSSFCHHHVAKEGLPPRVAPSVELAAVAVQATAAATLHAVTVVIHGGRGSKCAKGEAVIIKPRVAAVGGVSCAVAAKEGRIVR
ncbi:uncharacterized protein DS421_17g589180 [Arachis hypogaea]|nr:uncharacterized protein DS421_17g589180 [Arachis hypogaea]